MRRSVCALLGASWTTMVIRDVFEQNKYYAGATGFH
jgi:hypothetical protein